MVRWRRTLGLNKYQYGKVDENVVKSLIEHCSVGM